MISVPVDASGQSREFGNEIKRVFEGISPVFSLLRALVIRDDEFRVVI